MFYSNKTESVQKYHLKGVLKITKKNVSIDQRRERQHVIYIYYLNKITLLYTTSELLQVI